jgi:hypothetical protein
MVDIHRYGGFITNENLPRLEAVCKAHGVAKGSLLELLILGMTDVELARAIGNGRQLRSQRPDRRKERNTKIAKLRNLSSKKLDELLEQAEKA